MVPRGTGRQMRRDALMIYRFAGRKVAEQWAVEDWTTILREAAGYRPPWLGHG